jgi:succinoglycan biosynthesis transport protein ExoP
VSPLRIQLDRIRRRSWLVLAVMILAVCGAFAASWADATTYTGRSTLTITSENRAPEQDAVLAQGYADYFNEPSYQDTLRAAAGVPEEVAFAARTAAASPIVYIEAEAPDRATAASAASAIATAFREDVNENLRSGRTQAIEDLRNQISAERAELATVPDDSAESSLITNTILDLQKQVAIIQSNDNNQLHELQLSAGVAENSPNLVQNVALGLAGGLILGCLAALGFATVENRLATADEVRDQLGLDTLAVIPGGRSKPAARDRAQQMKRLANLVSLSDLPRPVTVAVTVPRATPGTSQVAQGIAAYRASQGERTLLIKGNLHEQQSQRLPGVAEFLAGPPGIGLDGIVLRSRIPSMQILPAGNAPSDPYALFARDRLAHLVEHAKRIADLVIIECPPINEAAESQVVCATADRVVLVIEQDATRAADAAEACQLLEQVDATLLGVVMTGRGPAAENPLPIGSPDTPTPPTPPTSSTPPAPAPIVGSGSTALPRRIVEPDKLTERWAP